MQYLCFVDRFKVLPPTSNLRPHTAASPIESIQRWVDRINRIVRIERPPAG